MNIILFGPPGAGKGTQAAILEKTFGFEKISTGDLIRKEIAQKTDLGISIQKIVESGSFPSDDVVMNIVENKIKLDKAHKIFDGIPRTLNQAQILEKLLSELEQKIDMVIFINLREDELIERITTRYNCTQCGHIYNKFITPLIQGVCDECQSKDFVQRADDNGETLYTRLKVYNAQTKPLIDYYLEKGIFHSIDGFESVETVSQHIKDLLSPMLVENIHMKKVRGIDF